MPLKDLTARFVLGDIACTTLDNSVYPVHEKIIKDLEYLLVNVSFAETPNLFVNSPDSVILEWYDSDKKVVSLDLQSSSVFIYHEKSNTETDVKTIEEVCTIIGEG